MGKPFSLLGTDFPASKEDRAQAVGFVKKIPGLLTSGAIKPLPILVWEGGLDKIKDGLEHMKNGKVSGQKIVYHIV